MVQRPSSPTDLLVNKRCDKEHLYLLQRIEGLEKHVNDSNSETQKVLKSLEKHVRESSSETQKALTGQQRAVSATRTELSSLTTRFTNSHNSIQKTMDKFSCRLSNAAEKAESACKNNESKIVEMNQRVDDIKASAATKEELTTVTKSTGSMIERIATLEAARRHDLAAFEAHNKDMQEMSVLLHGMDNSISTSLKALANAYDGLTGKAVANDEATTQECVQQVQPESFEEAVLRPAKQLIQNAKENDVQPSSATKHNTHHVPVTLVSKPLSLSVIEPPVPTRPAHRDAVGPSGSIKPVTRSTFAAPKPTEPEIKPVQSKSRNAKWANVKPTRKSARISQKPKLLLEEISSRNGDTELAKGKISVPELKRKADPAGEPTEPRKKRATLDSSSTPSPAQIVYENTSAVGRGDGVKKSNAAVQKVEKRDVEPEPKETGNAVRNPSTPVQKRRRTWDFHWDS